MVNRRKSQRQKTFENVQAFATGGQQPHKDASQFVGQPSPPLKRYKLGSGSRILAGLPTGPTYGRGFFRMKERLGPEKAEELRQQVLQDQIAAREKWGGQPVLPRDRDTYTDYPQPKSKRRKK